MLTYPEISYIWQTYHLSNIGQFQWTSKVRAFYITFLPDLIAIADLIEDTGEASHIRRATTFKIAAEAFRNHMNNKIIDSNLTESLFNNLIVTFTCMAFDKMSGPRQAYTALGQYGLYRHLKFRKF